MAMTLDFADSRYLGLRHGSRELETWTDLVTGYPAALLEAPDAAKVGRSIARLQGLDDGVVAPSTLHLFWDWFGGLHPRHDIIFADAHLYKVGKWGVERAAGKGVPVVFFKHHCLHALERLLGKKSILSRRPIVVTDGWCPLCGQAAPLYDYAQLLTLYEGQLVVDDTQALGVVGGGGLLTGLEIARERVVSISSLAKAFGAPLAALCGSATNVDIFRQSSETRVFASPVSAAAIRAANNALKINASNGNFLREILFRNVKLFRNSLAGLGISTIGGPFPAQFIQNLNGEMACQLHSDLGKRGFRSVLSTGHTGKPILCFLLNARHRPEQVEQLCEAILQAAGHPHYLFESTSNYF